jgi:hypothetical protein
MMMKQFLLFSVLSFSHISVCLAESDRLVAHELGERFEGAPSFFAFLAPETNDDPVEECELTYCFHNPTLSTIRW